MKLFKAIAAAAVISTFLYRLPPPTEARNGWMKGGCSNDGSCNYQKVLSANWPYVTYKNNTPSDMWTEVADCQQWRHRETHLNGKSINNNWKDAMPDSIGETSLINVCR